jgi:hypothetical protein
MPPSARRALAALAALVVAVLFGLSWTRPPAPVPASAPAEAFSSARALAHVAVIARRPHRIGSAEHAIVRAYLVEQLRAIGLVPEIQETLASQRRRGEPRFAVVRNVLARRPGTGAGKALLLVAHYDSRSMTPGASDDAFGVAALLESARALAAGGPPRSDVVFLFSDGEEEGLLGAHAFVTDHPWAADVGLVLNFEARGAAGPALMFQTGDENGALIRELARAAPHVAASSLSQEIYRRMPNDTDLSEWLPRTPALNFANIGGFERYHAPTDTPAALDEGTLQQHGEQALALARAFGARELPLPSEPDATYFNVGPLFVHYPGAWAGPLAAAAIGMLVAFLVVGTRTGALRLAGAGLGLVTTLAVIAGAVLGSAALWGLAERLHPAYAQLGAASPVMKGLYLAAFVALAVAVAAGAQARLARHLRPAELFAGAACVFGLLAALTAVYLPGGAFLFTWPALLAMGAGLALAPASRFESDAPLAVALQLAAPLPAIVLVAPFLPQLASAFGPSIAPAAAGLAALLAVLAAPALRHLPRRVAPLAALGLGAGAYLAASLHPAFDRDYPRPDTLLFAVDRDADRGFWLSPDAAPDAWTGAILAGATARAAVPLQFPFAEGAGILAREAAPGAEPGPAIVWLPDADDGRASRVRVVPPPGGELLAVRVDGDVVSARVEGRGVPVAGHGLSFRFHAPPAPGIVIELATRGAAPLTVRAVSQRAGLPDGPGPRPPGWMAKPGMMAPWDELLESDMTIVARTSTR